MYVFDACNGRNVDAALSCDLREAATCLFESGLDVGPSPVSANFTPRHIKNDP